MFHSVKDEHGSLLMNYREVMKRWRDYFEDILTEGFDHLSISHFAFGLFQPITLEESETAVTHQRARPCGGGAVV